ncbi:MAG: adenylate kinase [Erysipelotrichaceae bacterium]|nr:adenylate kinase [Erysipelotrichaceae bacterium]
MQKVLIIGRPGAGKSYFSRKLSEVTGIPVFHLDALWFSDDRTHITRGQLIEKLDVIMKKECWIIEGHYPATLPYRIKYCDTVIFLDYSRRVCEKGIRERIGSLNDDRPWRANAKDAEELIEKNLDFDSQPREEILQLLEENKDKNIIIFKTRKQSEKYLEKLAKNGLSV